MPDEEAPRGGAVVGFTRGEMFSTAHGGERLHSCDVCGAMVSGDRTGRHAKFHRGEGSFPGHPRSDPEPQRGRNPVLPPGPLSTEAIRCPECDWHRLPLNGPRFGASETETYGAEFWQHYRKAHAGEDTR